MLASTLRGARAKNVIQSGLDQLSTYGILSDMTQDEILLYVDALVAAGCLKVTGGAYPTVAITAHGNDVMRERTSVELALPETSLSALAYSTPASHTRSSHTPNVVTSKRPDTTDETYALYTEGLSIEEISRRRGLTEMTIEKHLADCILEGRPFDLSQHVSDADRAQIEIAVDQLGTQKLRPLRDALPSRINYRMIRFVVAEVERGERNNHE
jgi:uncharacterized protein YpbB